MKLKRGAEGKKWVASSSTHYLIRDVKKKYKDGGSGIWIIKPGSWYSGLDPDLDLELVKTKSLIAAKRK